MIYYPISDWTMFNLGCTVLTGQSTLLEAEEFEPDVVLPLVCRTAARRRCVSSAFPSASAAL